MSENSIEGGCACGAVRFRVDGRPIRAGLCHCMVCRKAHAAAFNPFVIYDRGQVALTGELQRWRSSAHYERCFCPACGSRVYGGYVDGPEIELSLGSFDAPGQVEPQYESWIIRREPWLAALAVPQNDRDRPDETDCDEAGF